MTLRRFAFALLLASLALVQPWHTAQMGVDEIRPGMIGTPNRVRGHQSRRIKVNILGCRERHRHPSQPHPREAEGGPLANTGVIAGMSGSPVYVDGRLIGAVSYALDRFRKNQSPASRRSRNDRRHRAQRSVRTRRSTSSSR
jgi:hypothetical protein